MKKQVLRLISMLGPFGTSASVLAAVAILAYPARSIARSISRIFTHEVTETSGGSAVIQKFESKFQYKPLIVLDSDILVLPKTDDGEVLPNGTKLPTRKQASLELEYRGYAEYVVDLDIGAQNVTTNGEGKIVSVQLAEPYCPFDSVVWQNSSATNSWSRIEGTDQRWVSWYQRNMGQFVTAAIHHRANTDANLKIAEEQTQVLVNAMIGALAADPTNGVKIIWRKK